jgi:peroxiredoxin
MKRWALPLGLLVFALAAVFYYQFAQGGARSRFPAPDFTLRGLDGQAYRLVDLRGKVIFLNLWATWCPPCRDEMPSMERLHQRFQGPDFVILAVSEDENSAPVRAFAEEMKLSFAILLDPNGDVPSRYRITGYPETFVIDRNGQVIQHFVGPEQWDSPKAFAYFAQLLVEAPTGATAGR